MGPQMSFEISATDHDADCKIVGGSGPTGAGAHDGKTVRQLTKQATMSSIALIFLA